VQGGPIGSVPLCSSAPAAVGKTLRRLVRAQFWVGHEAPVGNPSPSP
jgi:hypothetical protein